jgi:hypothetical protein
MMKTIRIILILLFATLMAVVPYSNAEDKPDTVETKNEQSIAISELMDDVLIQEATKVKEEFQQKVSTLLPGIFIARENSDIYSFCDRAKSGAGSNRIYPRVRVHCGRLIQPSGSAKGHGPG